MTNATSQGASLSTETRAPLAPAILGPNPAACGWSSARGPSTVRRSSRCEHIGLQAAAGADGRDVRRGLEALSGKVSTRYLQMARAALARAIRYAEAHDLVGRNVATLVDNPTGQIGRPSRSFTLAQSLALLEAARESRAERLRGAEPGCRHPVPRRPGNCTGITSTSTAIPARCGLCLRRWRSGTQHGRAATPRRPSHGEPWRCPQRPSMPCGSTVSGRPRGWRPVLCGRITTPRLRLDPGRRWTRRTSAVSSARSPKRPGRRLGAARPAPPSSP